MEKTLLDAMFETPSVHSFPGELVLMGNRQSSVKYVLVDREVVQGSKGALYFSRGEKVSLLDCVGGMLIDSARV